MKYRLILSPRAFKELSKLERLIKEKINKALFKLQAHPRESANFKFLKDKRLADFRLRAGDYRILYDIYENDKTVYILRIGHRKDVYH